MNVAPSPTHLFLEITTECQLRCQQCHFWTTKEGTDILSTEEKRRVVEAYLRMSPNGAVVFTGGEPLLRPEQLLALSGICRDANVVSVVNTNAAAIDDELATRLIKRGPTIIAVSLDSHEEAGHDRVRGVPGTFRRALSAIAALLRERVRCGTNTKIVLSSILCDLNYGSCTAFVEFAKRLGVDGVTFQALEHTFALTGRRDLFFENHWFRDVEATHAALDRLEAEHGGNPFLLLSGQDFKWLKAYVASRDDLPDHVCSSHERNLWVDMYGEVRLCAYMHRLPVPSSLGNVRRSTLAELWTGEAASLARPIMDECRLSCGMLNCHRRKT